MSKKVRNGLLIGGFAVALITFIWWFVGYYLDSWHEVTRAVWRYFVVRQFTPTINPLGWTPWAYLILTIIAGAVAGFLLCDTWTSYGWRRNAGNAIANTVITCSILTLVFGTYTITGMWNDDKDEANSYLESTEFVVEDSGQLPASLKPLTEGAALNDANRCIFGTTHDVKSCVTKGTLPANWDSRVASLTGAGIVMARTSGAVPNTDIMNETLTYLYNKDGSGVWSAIRNGRNRQPIDGIVSWDGQNEPGGCKFEGDHDLKYSFDGYWGQNLTDTLAKDFPALLFDYGDMWGYCQAKENNSKTTPAIVIPVVQQYSHERRTVLRAGGVLVITGSSSGEPVIEHRKSVKAGDLPGPVYPLSLVAKQREMLKWSAGRAHKNRLHFGYEASDVGTQNGNNGEYLLRDKDAGRLFWVTPLKPRSTSSQQLVAYSITPADEVGDGSLNTQRVYVLPDNKPVVNIDDMEARVSEAIRTSNPGFFTGEKPGRIAEFLPVDHTTWQVFAELNGRVVYRIIVPSSDKIRPTVQPLDSSVPNEKSTTPAPTDVPASCSNPGSLSDADLAGCFTAWHESGKLIVDELNRRHPK